MGSVVSTLERKQSESCGMGTSRDLMVLPMGAPLCSFLFPAFTYSWLYLSTTNQPASVFYACVVDGSNAKLAQLGLQCLSMYDCSTASDFNYYWAVTSF